MQQGEELTVCYNMTPSVAALAVITIVYQPLSALDQPLSFM